MTVSPKRAALIAAGIAMFMGLMDTQIVNVALATITRDLHTVVASAQWVITSYVLSLAVCVPASGWAGDRFGTKRVFLVAIVLFTTSSALCAVAPSVAILIVMRVIQGAGAGMLTPVGMAMLYRAYPPSERITAARAMSTMVVFAPASAPLIGGLIATELSWRWIFMVNVPVGILLFVFAILFVEDYRQENAGRYDPAGLLLGGPGLALLLFAVTDGPVSGWASAEVLSSAALGFALLTLFVRFELARRDPMLDLRLLGSSRLFRRCCSMQMIQSMAFFGPLVFTNLYIQQTRGFSALISGTITFPEAVAVGIGARVVGRIYKRVGPRRLLLSGFLVLIVGSCLLADVSGDTNLWLLRGVTFVLGIGNALIMLPVQAAAYSDISHEATGHATAIYQSLSRAASAVSVAILTMVLAFSAGTSLHPAPTDFHPVFFAAAGAAVVGLFLAWGIHDSDAAETMAPAQVAEEELAPA